MDNPAVTAPPPTGTAGALLERERELAMLDDLVLQARGGRPVLALFEGPAGIGKSRLLAEARAKADTAGFRVLIARGSELERDLPFGVVRQLFDPILRDSSARERWLCGSADTAARVFEPPEEGDAAGDVSFGVLHGLFWLTANVALDDPLFLSIDDLHWCDRASLRFIAYLERRLEGLRALVATAVRLGEPEVDSRLLGEIIHDPAAVAIRPSALSEEAVAAMVRGRLGAAPARPFNVACHRATGGNPLLLGELLKTLQAEKVRPDAAHAALVADIGPRAVSRTVLLRLGRLGTDAIAVARAVAVLGDGAELPATAALAGLDERRVAEATRGLAAAEILRADAPLGFVHPLVRDAVYLELSPAERELEHERAARVLSDRGAAPELVATHLLSVPHRADPRVAALVRAAGLAAGRRGDAESAVSYLRRALDEPAPESERPGLLLELGLAEGLVSHAAAAEHLRVAQTLLVDPLERALAAEALARMLIFTSPPREAVAVARQAVADLPAEYHDRRDAIEALELYAVAFGADVPDAGARLEGVRARGVGAGVGSKMLSAVAAWDWALSGGSAEECSDLALNALGDGSLIAEDPGFMTIVACGVLVLSDHNEALRVWDAAMNEGRRLGSLYVLSGVNLWRGWTWLQRGELVEAEDSLRHAQEQTALIEEPDGAGVPYVVAFLARVLLERGDLAGARAMLAARGNPPWGSDGDTLTRRSMLEVLLSEGRWAQALDEADEYHARLRHVDNPAWAPWRSLKALALEGLGRREEAIALLEDELMQARRWGAPGALARSLRLLGTIRHEEGLDHLREAAEVADSSAARLEHAKSLIALGSALRRARRPTDAREPLRSGFELATRCGAKSLAQHARAELYAAGGRPRRRALGGPDSLTPSELRIAEFAAEGQSNRDIAQTLYVTPKTVEVHLTSIYRKLGISARAGLSDALSRAEQS